MASCLFLRDVVLPFLRGKIVRICKSFLKLLITFHPNFIIGFSANRMANSDDYSITKSILKIVTGRF